MSASAHERPKDEYENGEPQEEVTRFLASSPMISSLFAAQPRKIVVQGAIVNDAYYKDSTLNGDMQMILGSRSSISGWGSVAVG
ncbi:hypothetical protein Q0P32_14435, partial [Staphylococcus aureus]|nr:hypothetical protein [Staphylococcus aureus]